MRILAPLLISLSALALPTAAEACRVFILPEFRISNGYANGAITGVAVVEIEQAEHIGEPYADTHPWRAQARIVQPLYGTETFPETVEFERGWGSSACEWSLPPLPRPGDRWVVYFFTNIHSELQPWLEMTLEDAARFDPTLDLEAS